MKIYTKTGDCGLSSLYTGERVSKTSPIFVALGSLDELNAHMAMTKALWSDETVKTGTIYSAPGAGAGVYRDKVCIMPPEYTGPPLYYEWFAMGITLTEIQQDIMDISSTVATPGSGDRFFNPECIKVIEHMIDRLDTLLPKLTKFLIPSGNKLCASIHVCRAICRRAERDMLSVIEPKSPSHVYINRLSDYLFVLSRFVCMSLDIEETVKK
jgi:cob(I)alamin adenosyltransferase